jgi:hypothetical protein
MAIVSGGVVLASLSVRPTGSRGVSPNLADVTPPNEEV